MYGPIRTTEQSLSIHDPTKAYDGYTLFAPHYGKDVWLIDMKGRVVHHWEMDHLPGGDGRLFKVKGGIPKTELAGGMWGNAFQEITPDSEVAWEWMGYEHMDPEIDVPCPLCPRTIWGYVNAIVVLPEGDILASFRHLNTIAIIDKRTGAIKWRWGAPHQLGHQHNPTLLDNGNILVFDNGYHRVTSHEVSDEISSRVIEVNPKTGDIEWEYEDENVDNFYSGICSSAQRLPNGNTLICESSKGRIFEVTPDKETVWEFISPFYYEWGRRGVTNLVFKAHRYGRDHGALRGKALDPVRFEWVLKGEGKPGTEEAESKRSEEVKRRLKRLGY